MRYLRIILFVSSLIIFPSVSLANVGVGVGLGKIQIDESLKSGGIYKLPSIPVLNTGDEAGEYAMEVTFQQEQTERRPDAKWFNFSPQSFHLDGGQSQTVEVSLVLPTNAEAGKYFAYLEAHPVKSGASGVSVGIAAATKLNFTLEAGTVLGAFTQRVKSVLTTYSPYSFVILGLLAVIIFVSTFRTFFSFSFAIKRKKSE